jgi:putative protease
LTGRKVELLAPAGSIAALKAACLAGADAVYLSGKRFGARAFASNFDEHSLRWARRVTSALNVKMFITLNTIVFEEEWLTLRETLDFYATLQPDALIIQDLGVARELAQIKSSIPLHLSTQPGSA